MAGQRLAHTVVAGLRGVYQVLELVGDISFAPLKGVEGV